MTAMSSLTYSEKEVLLFYQEADKLGAVKF